MIKRLTVLVLLTLGLVLALLLVQHIPSAAAYDLGTRTLQRGMKGDDVKELQIRVAGWAADSAQQTYVVVDGDFGPGTEAAVKRFQRAYGLTADGVVGSQTRQLLNSLEDSDGSTAHFAWSEFYGCQGKYGTDFSGGKVSSSAVKENVRRLMWKLEALRKKAGNSPVNINSGFRNTTCNTSVGGASNSMHLYGVAADIRVSGKTPYQVQALAKTCGFSGIGRYTTFVHVDSRMEYPYGSQFWWWPSTTQ
ncbi:MAG: peptidoglycan-binding protein [Anaerolineae bacterium]|nr:peptidoglycan-binding protein [Anaerolineae bacterium]